MKQIVRNRVMAWLLAAAVILGVLWIPAEKASAAGTPSVVYSAHVQSYGWMDEVSDGSVAGSVGERKRVEAFRMHISGNAALGIAYQTHVQTYGWQKEVYDGAVAGTTGKAKRMEAIRIHLTGAAASDYDIYYSAHVQRIGWMNWVKNGETAGTVGRGLRMEAVVVKILPKGSPAPKNYSARNFDAVQLSYRSHVQKKGWMDWKEKGETSGAPDEELRMEAFEVKLGSSDFSGDVEYRAHVQSIGWQKWVKNGAGAGTTGKSKRVEAMEIRLTGEIAGLFDVYYRTYVQDWGWTGWAKNGESCGSTGISYRMEAFEVKLVKKGSASPSRAGTILYREAKPAPKPEPEPAGPKYSPDVQALVDQAQGYSSSTRYLIMVNTNTHLTIVFEGSYGNWTPVRVCSCSVGAPESPTIKGNYRMDSKVLNFGEERGFLCWYASGISGNYLIHSEPYSIADAPSGRLDSRMGVDITQGCVRVQLENARWIYYNVPVGTWIHID